MRDHIHSLDLFSLPQKLPVSYQQSQLWARYHVLFPALYYSVDTLSVWMTSVQDFLAFRVSVKKSDVILIHLPLYVTWPFSLTSFNILSLFCAFSVLIIYARMNFFSGPIFWCSVSSFLFCFFVVVCFVLFFVFETEFLCAVLAVLERTL